MKKAVIMAGGFGTRLRPLTYNIPKPMVPMLNRPMMEHIVNLLKKHSFKDITSLLFFHPDEIISYFGNGEDFDISMNYVQATADYGTAGSVKNAQEFLDESFLVISGDILTDFDLSDAIKFHKEKKAKATIILTKASNPLQFGIVMTSPDGAITRFLEKPSWGEVFSDTINTGIYILEPEVLDLIPFQKEFDFSKDLFPAMLAKNMPLFGYVAEGYWQDVGNLNQYQEAHRDVFAGKVHIDFRGNKVGSSYIAESASVHPTATLKGMVIIGENVVVGEYAEVVDSVIGHESKIGSGAKVISSVLWDDVQICEYAEVSHDVICTGTVVGVHATIAENVFIADNCIIGEYSQLTSNIKLWPNRVVEARAMLSHSLVLEEKWLRELFTDARVTGISNIEMNPEFGAKFGAALGNAFGAKTRIVGSRDANIVSRMIKRAITAGMMSVGVDIVDLQTTPLPLTRQELIGARQVAGFHVRTSPYFANQIDIIVLNADGRDLSSSSAKKIERLFFGEDIKRSAPEDVGSIYFPERTLETYLNRYVQALDIHAIADRKFNAVVDYSFGMSATIFPRILGELRANAIGLNAYVDTILNVRSDTEYFKAREQMSKVITSLGYEIGFIIDPSAEKIAILDEEGRWYHPVRLLSLVTKLFLDTHRHREPYKIAVPVSATSDIDEIIKGHDIELLRIKDSHSAMIESTRDKNILFVGGTRGRFIFTDFFFASDAMFTIGKIMEMLALSDNVLSDLHRSVPERVLLHEQISCPWDKKGKIMRKVMELSEGKERLLLDGVKIYENGNSVLFLPDKEHAIFHIMAEAASEIEAKIISKRYISLFEQWRDEH